jgi:hypothetical protein
MRLTRSTRRELRLPSRGDDFGIPDFLDLYRTEYRQRVTGPFPLGEYVLETILKAKNSFVK